MNKNEIHAVTGAFGYSGRYIAARLLEQGRAVVTLTNSIHRANPFGGRVRALPLSFGEPDKLAAALSGVDVLYNTYWVRFNHRMFTHAQAVANTLVLFDAARRAGVRRVVHVSIANPEENSPLEYFAGKARLERALRESGLSYAILRPTFQHFSISAFQPLSFGSQTALPPNYFQFCTCVNFVPTPSNSRIHNALRG
jgi:uncharacterized protein YbjT (DUF2867 family)